MPTLTTAAEKGEALDRITVDQLEAERITNLPYKTLERHTLAGEPVGRIKVGRRVLFVRDVLEAWIKSKLTATANYPPRNAAGRSPPHHLAGGCGGDTLILTTGKPHAYPPTRTGLRAQEVPFESTSSGIMREGRLPSPLAGEGLGVRGVPMTETEWLISTDPQPMLDEPTLQGLSRKLTLFAVVCTRRVFEWRKRPWWADRAVTLLGTLEQYGEGRLSGEERIAMVRAVLDLRHDYIDYYLDVLEVDFCAVLTAVDNEPLAAAIWAALNSSIAISTFRRRPERFEAGGTPEAIHQTHLLRCIFGNPFRTVAFHPRWRTETAVALAAGIYDLRAFDRLPILADALEDAGGDDLDVLSHCRRPGPHARGCWVVDAVLGKS